MSVDLSKHEDPKFVKSVRVDTLDMTQEQFADLMGVSVATLRNWEQGQTPVPVYFIRALRVFLADPGTAMSALGAGRSLDGPGKYDWRSVPDGPGRQTQKIAAEKLAGDPDFALMMDLGARAKKFRDLARDLGCDMDMSAVMGLAVLAALVKPQVASPQGRFDK